MQLAVDTGGTFTDLVVKLHDGSSQMFKASTTPSDPVAGVLNALEKAATAHDKSLHDFLGQAERLVHGTTHALNAVITGNAARTALLVTQGHGDILTLREGGRDEAFNFTNPYPGPYIPRSLTYEVPERIRADGSVALELDEGSVLEIIEKLKSEKIEAVAICLLWSVANRAHEARLGALLDAHLPGIPFTLSADINPAIREFRRASSAAIDASLKPLMGKYMSQLESRLRACGFLGRTLIVTSQAGVIDAGHAAQAPIHILNSGPSMAPLAGRYFARVDEQAQDVIVADTGGTTYDVCLVRSGRIPTTRETWIGPPLRGIMIGFPSVAVQSVGAGGGSIAWIDKGGLLHVGPQSAGAEPGPVAYGQGGKSATMTDASVVLGHLDPNNFLGGAMRLDLAAATRAIENDIANPLGIDVASAADAILTIATENMVQAIVDITVHEGADPQQAVLIGGGGAAGLNSVRIGRRLGCARLIIPEAGAALSAAGATMSDLKSEFRSAFYASTQAFDFSGVQHTLAALQEQAHKFIGNAGKNALSSKVSATVEARYASQVWEIEVPLRQPGLATPNQLETFLTDFHATHKSLFAYDDVSSHIEITGWSVEARCRFQENDHLQMESPDVATDSLSVRRAYFSETGWTETPVYSFGGLNTGQQIAGPAIVESAFTTVVVDPGALAVKRPSGSLSIDLGRSKE